MHNKTIFTTTKNLRTDNMTSETEKKIIDAALKLFFERGYVGATTLAIAEESGFSEKTLFRKFKTKQNLFNTTILQKGLEMQKYFEKFVLVDKEFENPREFLETLINNCIKMGDHYFELFHLTLSERTKIHEPIMTEFNFKVTEYIQKNITTQKIDYMTFTLTINAFIYMIMLEKKLKHVVTVAGTGIDHDNVLKKFIDNSLLMIES